MKFDAIDHESVWSDARLRSSECSKVGWVTPSARWNPSTPRTITSRSRAASTKARASLPA